MEGRFYFCTLLGLKDERVSLGGLRGRRAQIQIQIGRSWAVIRRRQGTVERGNQRRYSISDSDDHYKNNILA